MDLPTLVSDCVTKKYAAFRGRASRQEFWWFTFMVLAALKFTDDFFPVASLYVALVLLCPHMAAGFRRLHDTGRSGFLLLIPSALAVLMPPFVETSVNSIVVGRFILPDVQSLDSATLLFIAEILIYLLFLWWLIRPSQPETNQYGPPPVAAA